MWKGRFRQRCLASSKRREENADTMGDAEEDQEAEEAEHEEVRLLLSTTYPCPLLDFFYLERRYSAA